MPSARCLYGQARQCLAPRCDMIVSVSNQKTLTVRWGLLIGLCVPGIFLAAALHTGYLTYDRAYSSYDDGVAAEGARLVRLGWVPYRDFWTMYGPGSLYANALAFAIGGERLLALRVAALLQLALQASLLWTICRRTIGQAGLSLLCCAVFLALVPLGMMCYWFTVFLAALYCMVRLVQSPGTSWAAMTGLLAGLLALFRLDAGVYFAVAAFVVAFTASSAGNRGKILLSTGGGFAAVMAGAAAYFGAVGAIGPMVTDALWFPIFVFPGSRPLPYPNPLQPLMVAGPIFAPVSIAFLYQLYGFYLMPALSVSLLARSVAYLRKRGGSDRAQLLVFAILLLAVVIFLMARVRPSGARIMASAVLLNLALAMIAARERRAARVGAVLGLLLALAAFAPFGAFTVKTYREYNNTPIRHKAGVFAPDLSALSAAAVSQRIRAITAPSEKILCGAPIVYFLSERQPATRYFEPHPGLTDTARVQRSIIRDIESNRVRLFVRSREWDRQSYFTIEPANQPSMLVDYIGRNYRLKEDFRLFQICERSTPFSRP